MLIHITGVLTPNSEVRINPKHITQMWRDMRGERFLELTSGDVLQITYEDYKRILKAFERGLCDE